MSELFAPGTRCGEWTISKKLGGAGQSEIYLASREDFHGKAITSAIRTIKMDRNDPQIKRVMNAFAVEYEALSKLDSKHISKVYDYGISPHFWIATEFVRGKSLEEKLHGGPLDLSEWTSFAIESLTGLIHAHESKVIHQDIKPGNIMLKDRSNSVVWIDFGSATILGKSDAGYNGGAHTLAYVAPERMDQSRLGDAKTDLYSLGVMLYEAATGSIPWEGVGNVPEEVYEAKMRLLVDFSKLKDSQRKLIEGLLHPNPEARPTGKAALNFLGTGAATRVKEKAKPKSVNPGERFVRFHAGRDGMYWDILESRSRKVIGRAATREEAEEYVLGLRDIPLKKQAKPRGINLRKPPVNVAKSASKPAESLKKTSLVLCLLGGVFHPIVPWVWFKQFKSTRYLTLAIIGSILSLLYFTWATTLPSELDPVSNSRVFTSSSSILMFPAMLACLANAIIAHTLRPKLNVNSVAD